MLTKARLTILLCAGLVTGFGFLPAPNAQTNLTMSAPSSPAGTRQLLYQGQPVFLAGSGSFWLLNDPFYYHDDGTTNLTTLREHLDKYKPANAFGKAKGVIRVSAFGSPVRYSGVDYSKKRYPCRRTGPGTAEDGGLKFDCSQFDDQYFNHLMTVLREADARGIVLGIILWDEISLESEGPARWEHNPFCAENNINQYGLPSCSSNAVSEFYDANGTYGNLRDHQDAIVNKFVDELKDEPNVFFFVSNEYTGPDSWRDRQINTINDRCAVQNCDLLHVTMIYSGSGSTQSDGISCDTTQFCQDDLAWRPDGRPSVTERDCNACGTYRPVMWDRFMHGVASAGTRDDYSGDTDPTSTFGQAAAEDEQLRSFVNSLSGALDQLVPNSAPFGDGWNGRFRAGTEYVAYSDGSSGSITVDLQNETGSWELFDWDPTSSSPGVSRGFRSGGSSVTWDVRSGEAAVRIVRSGSTDSTPPSVPAGLSGAALDESRIQLSWSPSTDAESGVAYYVVYRDGTFAAQAASTDWTDTGLAEATTYSYTVAATNGAGLESTQSAAVPVTTLADTDPPSILSVVASGDPETVLVNFDEPVEAASATTVSNYGIDNGITVNSASLQPDLTTASLSTSAHAEGTIYTLTVNDVRDRASTPNTIAPGTTVTYSYLAELVVSGLTVTSGRAYEVAGGWGEGSPAYIDRGFTYSGVPPALTGSTYVKTANDDKLSQGDSFLSFDVNQNVTVYVAHDDLYSLKPTWLQSFADSGDDVVLVGGNFSLFRKEFPAGTVVLGGNVDPAEAEDNSMYGVVIVSSGTSGPSEPPPPPESLAIE